MTLNEFEKNTRTRGTDTLMSESYALLNQKEYSKALNLLKNAPNTEGVFPTAIAYFLNKQYAEALPIFERLTNDGFYKADLTNYYAALCVLANGQKDAAIKRFTTIANDKENEYSDKALLVLKRFGY